MDDINFKDKKVLDYGCGYGADVKHLHELGIDAYGYDKYIKSEFNTIEKDSIEKFDIVLCTYVINTIPELGDELKIIIEASNKLIDNGSLIITTRTKKEVDAQAKKSNWTKYKAGYITKSGTFQAGFSPHLLERFMYWIRSETNCNYAGIRTIANSKFTSILATKGNNEPVDKK